MLYTTLHIFKDTTMDDQKNFSTKAIVVLGIIILAIVLLMGQSRKDASSETEKAISVFWGKSNLENCEDVSPAERTISEKDVARGALLALLAGPTTEEETAGYFSSINPNIALKGLVIDESGIARADFSKELDERVAGSCRVTHIRAQIMKTVLQFSTIKGVIISIDGQTEGILQP